MEAEDKELLQEIVGKNPEEADSYNIRKNGKKLERKVNPNINIVSKEDNSGISQKNQGRGKIRQCRGAFRADSERLSGGPQIPREK